MPVSRITVWYRLISHSIAEQTLTPSYLTSAEAPLTTRSEYTRQRVLECVPAVLLGLAIAAPMLLWFYSAEVAYVALCGYLVYWAARSVDLAARQAYESFRMRRTGRIDWRARLAALNDPYARLDELARLPRLTRSEREERDGLLCWIHAGPEVPSPDELWHLVVVPVVDEDSEIIEQSLHALLATGCADRRLAVCLSFEERSRTWDPGRIAALAERYADRFGMLLTTRHPDGLPGEGKVKGANITWAARHAREALHRAGIEDRRVVVSAFDCDTRAAGHYFHVLSWTYLTDPGREINSYQPILLFHNNVWQVPATSRLVGYIASMWTMVDSTRRNTLRIFSSHAIGMHALAAVGFWSTNVIPDDSRQYWRMFYASDGRASTRPLHTPVYLDAVHGKGYLRSLTEQYLQIRRWSYGVIDFPYIMDQNAANARIPVSTKIIQTVRQLGNFHQWAITPLVLIMARGLVGLIEPQVDTTGHNLTALASHLYSITPPVTIGSMCVGMLVALSLLPKRPISSRLPALPTYAKLGLEWLLLPIVVPLFFCLPAIESQLRLAGGRYLGFRVTVKNRVGQRAPNT